MSSSGEVGEVFVEDAQGARADRAGCGGAERAQAGCAGGVRAALEEVSGGGGVAARLRDIARVQLGHGEINKRENPVPAGGGRQVLQRGGQRGPGCGVVAGLEVNMAGRCRQVS